MKIEGSFFCADVKKEVCGGGAIVRSFRYIHDFGAEKNGGDVTQLKFNLYIAIGILSAI